MTFVLKYVGPVCKKVRLRGVVRLTVNILVRIFGSVFFYELYMPSVVLGEALIRVAGSDDILVSQFK